MVTARGGAVEFGAKLREHRRSLGLSQSELGGDRFTGSYISHLESGRRSASREVLEFLAMRLGVKAEELGMTSALTVPGDIDDRSVEALEHLLVAERAWHDREWGTAAALAARAATAAQAGGQFERHWEALYVQAQANAADGRYIEAAALAQQLADHSVAARSKTLRAQALSLASTSYRSSDQLVAAVATAAQAVELSDQAAPIILADALMSLISAMLEAGRPTEQTEALVTRLSDVALHVESEHVRGIVSWTLGTVAYRAGRPADGRALHESALALISPRRDLRMWLRLHRVIATNRLDVSDVEGVGDLLRTARSGLSLVGNPYDLFELAHAEALLASVEGRNEDAAALIEATLADPDLAEPVATNGRVLELFGAVLERLGRIEDALGAYERAAKTYDKQDHFRRANVCWQRASQLRRDVVRIGVKDRSQIT